MAKGPRRHWEFWGKETQAQQRRARLRRRKTAILASNEIKRIEYQRALNSLTNHERHLWNRAGSPGRKQQDALAVLNYSVSHQLRQAILKKPESLAMGLARLLPAARAALAKAKL